MNDFINDAKTHTPKQLSEKYGITVRSVYRRLEKQNLKPVKSDVNPKNVWLSRECELKNLYCEQLLSLDDIAKYYGVSPQRMHYVISTYFPNMTRNKKNLLRYINEEYLNSKTIPDRKLNEVRSWMFKHSKELLDLDGSYLTTKDEDTVSYYKADYFEDRLYA
jgi:Zn-dependent peptidase ImmA (M78 family)